MNISYAVSLTQPYPLYEESVTVDETAQRLCHENRWLVLVVCRRPNWLQRNINQSSNTCMIVRVTLNKITLLTNLSEC